MRGERSDGAGTRARAPAARAATGEAAASAIGGAEGVTVLARAEAAALASATGGAEGVRVMDTAEGDGSAPVLGGAVRAALDTAEGAAAAPAAGGAARTPRDTANATATAAATRGADRTVGGRAAAHPAASAAPTPGDAARATPLGAATRASFLDQLAMLGCPARAAAAVGIALVSVYALRRRNARFAAAWRDALAIGYERLEAEALRHLLERETPLDLAAALALLDRHRAAAAGAVPVAPPRAPRRQRHPLGPAGAELARRLKLYAGVTPGVRRAPVSPAAAAEVDSFERAAAADWDEREEAVAAPADRDAVVGADAAHSHASGGTAADVDPDARVDADPTDRGAGSDARAASAIDRVAATAAETEPAPDSSCSAAPAGAQETRAPHVGVRLDPGSPLPRAPCDSVAAAPPSHGLPAHAGSQGQADQQRATSSPPGLARAREHEQTIAGPSSPRGRDTSGDRRGRVHEGLPNAGWPTPADPSGPAIGSAAEAAWPARSSAPEGSGTRSAVDTPDVAVGSAAPARAAPPVAAGHLVSDTPPAAVDARVGARRSACPVEPLPPGVTAAPRPRVWA